MENIKQEDNLALEIAAKAYLQRLSIIWSSPLSDYNKVMATNQFALPVMEYLMWTQTWPIAELQRLDRESRKVIVENGGKHPLGSTSKMYLPRNIGGRGLKSIEQVYKLTKVKAAVKMYTNPDPTMKIVREFEEKASRTGRRSLIKDANKYAQEMGLELTLEYPEPKGHADGEEVCGTKIGAWGKAAQRRKRCETTKEEKWQGKFMVQRWNDENLDRECFSWCSNWRTAPTHTIAGIQELYEQLLPTKIYHQRKTGLNTSSDVICRMCSKELETLSHILSGCSALAQTKYLARHNAALKIFYFEMLLDLNLIRSIPPWFSPEQPKPLYENQRAKAYWDVPVYADHIEVRANRIDARIVDTEKKKILLLEMSCPWMENRNAKEKEKTLKYAPLRFEMKKQYPDYEVTQYNIIIDVLGGFSKELSQNVKKLVGESRSKSILRRMQKSVLSNTLNIARTFKILSSQ